jgi:hypothetical protein
MKRFIQQLISLNSGHTTIRTNNNANYIIRQQYWYEPNSKFIYQYGHISDLVDFKEEKNSYVLANNNQLPLKCTHFICSTTSKNNTLIEKFIKNNSDVKFFYLKVFNKEFMFIRSL